MLSVAYSQSMPTSPQLVIQPCFKYNFTEWLWWRHVQDSVACAVSSACDVSAQHSDHIRFITDIYRWSETWFNFQASSNMCISVCSQFILTSLQEAPRPRCMKKSLSRIRWLENNSENLQNNMLIIIYRDLDTIMLYKIWSSCILAQFRQCLQKCIVK